jgi:hypothetical protein
LSREVYRELYRAEEDAGHSRTILVGDFNMNPYEKGMIDQVSGFGAMASRSLAERHSESGRGGSRRFYNPMWSRLGGEIPRAPGTHYWKSVADPFNIFWHSLDQVLVRPALIHEDAFRDEDFQVLTTIPGEGGEPIYLIRSTGKHWELQVSDHLPIVFKLALPSEDAHV